MPEASSTTTFVFWAVVALTYFAPGADNRSERPKKGFWQARNMLWPIRKFQNQQLTNPQLSKAYGGSLLLAFLVSGVSALAVRFISNVSKTISPIWLRVNALRAAFFWVTLGEFGPLIESCKRLKLSTTP